MVEETGLLNQTGNQLFDLLDGMDPICCTEDSFSFFFEQLFMLAGEELEQNQTYALIFQELTLDELFEDEEEVPLELECRVNQMNEKAIQAILKGQGQSQTGKVTLTGTVSWDRQQPLRQQRLLNLAIDAKVATDEGTVALHGNYEQRWNSK